MAFQDFDYLSERRRQERKQKIQKRITIGVVSAFVILLVAALCAVVYKSPNNEPRKSAGPGHVSQSIRTIKTLCEGTDYKSTCESSLESAVISHPSATQPTDILKLAISVVENEVDKVSTEIQKLKYDTPMKKAGAEVCLQVLTDAKEEINSSISSVGNMDLGSLSLRTPDLNNWLSAVMSYQETCVDALIGEAKSAVAKTLRHAEELTSNSLAIVSQVGSVLSTFHPTVASSNSVVRHLLLEDENIPGWVNEEDRRMLKSEVPKWCPNVTVAKDGSGNYSTISAALAAMPQKYKGRYVIYVKEGIYDESVIVTKKMINVTIYGDGSQKSVVTGSKSYDDGVPTFRTATFAAAGEGFMAQSMGFRNTAGPEKHQAVALRVQSDRSIFLNCRMEGYQDTLYAQTHRQFYKGCYITGTIDFIFGDAAAIFQNCMFYLKKPFDNQKNVITAQGRASKRETTGFVLHNCRILADENFEAEKRNYKSYLGRPWKKYSRTIVMETEISDVIDPEGWLPLNESFALKSLYYGEYNNKGGGADLKGRVKWAGFRGALDKEVAMTFTVSPFIQGESWLKAANISVRWGLNS